MITTTDRFERLLRRADAGALTAMRQERQERISLLDKFAGTEGFEVQIKTLEDDIEQLDSALDAAIAKDAP